MTEHGKEATIIPLPSRTSPIKDEVLEEYVLQINKGRKDPDPCPNFKVEFLEEVRAWATLGMSYFVAAAIAKFEISDAEAKSLLATALENNADYFCEQPMYSKMKKRLNSEIQWMQNAARRLRGEDI